MDSSEVPPIVEAATKRSGVLWLDLEGDGRERLAWYVWQDGSVYVVHGGIEQDLPGLAQASVVTVAAKSKDTGGRVVRWVGLVSHLVPSSPAWAAVVPALHAARLNPPDGEGQPARWARESTITRIEPTGELAEAPDAVRTDSGAATPPYSPATTAVPKLAWIGRRRPRRPLA